MNIGSKVVILKGIGYVKHIWKKKKPEKKVERKLKNVNPVFVEESSLPLVKAIIDITRVGKTAFWGEMYIWRPDTQWRSWGWQKSDHIPTFHLSPSFKAAVHRTERIVTIFVRTGEKGAHTLDTNVRKFLQVLITGFRGWDQLPMTQLDLYSFLAPTISSRQEVFFLRWSSQKSKYQHRGHLVGYKALGC